MGVDEFSAQLGLGSKRYLAKPVNTEQLLATLRLWLHR
jgi:DNA-binding response OmpR family regulator